MKNVLICGLGAVGMTYGYKFKEKGSVSLRVLVDEKRLERYRLNKPVFNGEEQTFDYILPQDEFKPDLIIIATKAQGLNEAVRNLKNFVSKETIILSLLNGISSEEIIKSAYPEACVLKSYFIGHSAVRSGNSVTQDGVGKIVFEKNQKLAEFFDSLNIDYECPENMDYALWLKYAMNIFSNQTSAVLNMTFGELKNNKNFIEFAKKIISEVRAIAEKEGVTNLNNLEKDALNVLSGMCDEGKTSMLQDILAGRQTEVDIFAGEIIRLGQKYNVETPYNKVLYDLIKIEEENNEHRVYSR